jgi:transcriptional regulator with XRE-family HTH domain
MDATTTLGGRLRAERKRLGLLQPAFAEMGGVKRVSQHLYEQDERVPDANYFLRMYEHGVDVVYVLLGKRQIANAIELDLNTLCDIYRVVDELGRDDSGESLPLGERLRLFSLLTAAQSGNPISPAIDDMRRRLRLCLSAAA